MAINYVTLVVTEQDAADNAATGRITIAPTSEVVVSGVTIVGAAPVIGSLAGGSFQVNLVATDNPGTSPAAGSWAYSIALPGQQALLYALPYSGGAVQRLDNLTPLAPPVVPSYASYMPMPSGTPTSGQVPVATGSGAGSSWGSVSGGSGGGSASAVQVTTTGASFSPSVSLAAGSTAVVTWASPGFSPVTGTQPTLNFGSPATRKVYMTAVDANGYDAMNQVIVFNLGFLSTDDAGQSSLSSSYNWASQAVTGVANLQVMKSLQIFCAANIPGLTGLADFSGLAQLQHVECYGSGLTGVCVSGCTSMIRLCVEINALTYLDINPVQPGLADLRTAGQAGGALTLKPLGIPALSEWHFCARDQVVTNMPDFTSQFPALKELWIWNTGQSGALAPSSGNLTNVQAYSNSYTSATFTAPAFSANQAYLDLHSCLLSSVTLPAANGLSFVDLHNNLLTSSAVNAVLSNLAANTISNGTVNVGGTGNATPTGAGITAVTALQGRQWTVTTSSGGGGGGGGSFTHKDSGFNSSTSAASLAITLSGAVSAGDLLVMMVQNGGFSTSISVSDSASNTWTTPDGGLTWYRLASAASAGGLTITATTTSGYIHQMVADRFTPASGAAYGGVVETGASGTLGLNYSSTGCGALGTVPAGALAWGAFSVDDTTGNQAYTPGFQNATTAPADVIGSQFTGAGGTGLSVYVTNCSNESTTLSWYGTGAGAIGHAVSAYFT